MTREERERELRQIMGLTFLDAYHRASGRPRGELPPKRMSPQAVIELILDFEFPRGVGSANSTAPAVDKDAATAERN